MTMDTLSAIVVFTVPFIIFAGVLFWAQLQTPARGASD